MAAGLGFKDFVTGEVLTAADVDGYLMQGIWVFASAAARDAAVTSPQEGNFAYLKDTNTTTYYTGSAWTNLDTTGMVNPMTTTGDTIYSSSGSTPARLGIGSTGQVLTVAGGIPSWATPASGTPTFVGASAYSTDQSIPNATYTAVNWSAENFDTNGFHDNSTNNTRMTIPAGKGGYYQISFQSILDSNTTGNRVVRLYKNGSYFRQSRVGTSGATPVSTILVNLNLVATDYIEIYVFQTSGGNITYELIDTSGWFNITYLGA